MPKSRIHVAVGPITPRVSWKWLGPHLAESLGDSCTVRFFRGGNLPHCDVAVFIKERPRQPLRQAIDRACPIVFMPVDFYRSRAQLDGDAEFLRQCAGLLVHSRRLERLLERHNPAIWYVDHPNFYGLADRAPYRPDGHVLWIGDLFNLPWLLRWRKRIELPYELKILTNGRRTSIGGMAMTLDLADRLGIELDVRPGRINGIATHEWDAATQRAMMATCKAAVDIRGGDEDFNQFTKPPTKAQQFIVSGIPFAVDAGSSIAREMRESGIEVADVEDQEYWFSHEYWKRTQAFAAVIEERTRPGAVAARYRHCLAQVLARVEPRPTPPPARSTVSPPVAAGAGLVARWRGYARAWRVLRRLGGSWRDMAPHGLTKVLDACDIYVPGYVTCREGDAAGSRTPVAVSVLADVPGSPETDGVGALPSEIPDDWEIIVPFSPAKGTRAGHRLKAIQRWPRRGLVRDRMLRSTYAEGACLAFVSRLDLDQMAWIGKAAAALDASPETAMIRRKRAVGSDVEATPAFLIRRDVWQALGGYSPGPAIASPRCSDLDLQRRIQYLGFRIETGIETGIGARTRAARTPQSASRTGGMAVIYTAITNRHDRLLSLEERCVRPARQVAFLDRATRSAGRAPSNWEIRDIEQDDRCTNRGAKIYKVRPERYFPDVRYSLWIDGNVFLIYPFDIQRLIDLFLAEADLCIFRHHARSCIYREADACKIRRLDSARLIDAQVARYRQEGFPEQYGLHEAVVILRRHSRAVEDFNRRWWQEISRGSQRDQLSFDYVRWKTGLPVAEFPLSIQEHNGLFAKGEHARRRSPPAPARSAMRKMIRRLEAFHLRI